ncbi:uncharacterized protein SOCG_05905 [Schizosaccharomyces octosporus yFS286]|uniref:Uncharacterized protein n=1 Tax=Schizosaccharomyces octosporus (strain yFS286) TaxID=483514 RepID=S9PT96_SCHOY|nr:uncharacterized protein SOCG_05905 [Schizosaccharomyces octosporus yFS286]EPX70723.1 hypothetical protein SOCG_05905 [Schizosaccharomyces octosporus yFS286]
MRFFLLSLFLISLLGVSFAFPYGNAALRNATSNVLNQGYNTTSMVQTNSTQVQGKFANATSNIGASNATY